MLLQHPAWIYCPSCFCDSWSFPSLLFSSFLLAPSLSSSVLPVWSCLVSMLSWFLRGDQSSSYLFSMKVFLKKKFLKISSKRGNIRNAVHSKGDRAGMRNRDGSWVDGEWNIFQRGISFHTSYCAPKNTGSGDHGELDNHTWSFLPCYTFFPLLLTW